jgi:hypothetical protein
MNFTDLYRYADGLNGDLVSVEDLRRQVIKDHPVVEAVDFWACDLEPKISLGHMILTMDRSSAYDHEYVSASIRFDKTRNTCWRRFICCKELMHVFDSSLAMTSDATRFMTLMNELENNPISVDSSPMFNSERNAEWMALLVLFPQRLREQHFANHASGAMTDYEIALRTRIPETYVRSVMSDRYGRALEVLTGIPLLKSGKITKP